MRGLALARAVGDAVAARTSFDGDLFGRARAAARARVLAVADVDEDHGVVRRRRQRGDGVVGRGPVWGVFRKFPLGFAEEGLGVSTTAFEVASGPGGS